MFRRIDVAISLFVCVLLLPLFACNALVALLHRRPVFVQLKLGAVAGQIRGVKEFGCGWQRGSARWISVLQGQCQLVGLSFDQYRQRVQDPSINEQQKAAQPLGLFSYRQLHQRTGLQGAHGLTMPVDAKEYAGLVLRSLIAQLLYSPKQLKLADHFYVFGVRVDNLMMQDAVRWACRAANRPKVGYFVNVHSLNLSQRDGDFHRCLNQADRIMADGSGVRMAAQRLGIQLQDNVNGTDLLPFLCEQLVFEQKSLYLLGGAPGVADEAAKKLAQRYPGLRIAGSHHGYFDANHSKAIVDIINASGAHVCLVALGSPLQERWIQSHRDELRVNSLLAVGGLFDFFSGRMPCAPLWMRQLGLEWLYRLYQEPKAKFRRYVLGNPLFLWRIYWRKRSDNRIH